MDKLEWFPFNAFAWATDDRVVAMSDAARGVYTDLLVYEWINGGLPLDLNLARPRAIAATVLVEVEPCFPVGRSCASRRFNPKLEEIRTQQEAKLRSYAERGKKGGIASGVSRRSSASPASEAQLRPASSSASISPVLSTAAGEAKAGIQAEAEISSQRGLALVHATIKRRTKEAALDLAAKVIFTYWRDRMGKSPATTRFDDRRRKRLVARLRENDGQVSELLYVVDGALRDDWTMGRTERSAKSYNGIETIFRDRGKVEELLALMPKRLERHPYLENRDGLSAST